MIRNKTTLFANVNGGDPKDGHFEKSDLSRVFLPHTPESISFEVELEATPFLFFGKRSCWLYFGVSIGVICSTQHYTMLAERKDLILLKIAYFPFSQN